MLVADYRSETFDHKFKLGPGHSKFGPNVFTNCTFQGCSVRSTLEDPVRLIDQRIQNATVRGGAITGVIVEDCVLDGLRVRNMPAIAGCVFRHVVIRGRINQLIIHGAQQHVGHPELAAAENALLAQHYANTDWALDISGVDSPDFSIRGIPTRLIKRDPHTQAILTYETALGVDWDLVDMSGTNFCADVALLLGQKSGESLLIASRTGKSAQREQEVIRVLRSRGLVS